MRVISGTARSLVLKTVKSLNTRPTTDKIKETLFNILSNDVAFSTFLDLFSGSGAIGIEALSRGASKAYFVEKQKEALNCIKHNLEHTKLKDNAYVYAKDVLRFLKDFDDDIIFNIIFIDPPYNKGLEVEVLKILESASYIDTDSLIIVELRMETELFLDSGIWDIMRIKEYKSNKHIFIKRRI